jgi:hypothetical protein
MGIEMLSARILWKDNAVLFHSSRNSDAWPPYIQAIPIVPRNPTQAVTTPSAYGVVAPSSAMMISAAFSPIASAVLFVFAPTFAGAILKSASFNPWTP